MFTLYIWHWGSWLCSTKCICSELHYTVTTATKLIWALDYRSSLKEASLWIPWLWAHSSDLHTQFTSIWDFSDQFQEITLLSCDGTDCVLAEKMYGTLSSGHPKCPIAFVSVKYIREGCMFMFVCVFKNTWLPSEGEAGRCYFGGSHCIVIASSSESVFVS